jgi:hypothetical protein
MLAVAATPVSADQASPEQTSPPCLHPVSIRVGGQDILEAKWRAVDESMLHSYQPIQDPYPHDYVFGSGVDRQIVWDVIAHAPVAGKIMVNEVHCDNWCSLPHCRLSGISLRHSRSQDAAIASSSIRHVLIRICDENSAKPRERESLMRTLSILLAPTLVGTLFGFAPMANAQQPAGHPISCSIEAPPPIRNSVNGQVTTSGKIQCSEPVKWMNFKISVTGPDGKANEYSPPSSTENTSVLGYTWDTPYVGPGTYRVIFWGTAYPYPEQDNGLNSSAVNDAAL